MQECINRYIFLFFFMKTDILAFYQDYSIFPLKKLFLSYVTGVNRSFLSNFGILFLVPYTKDFGKITQF